MPGRRERKKETGVTENVMGVTRGLRIGRAGSTGVEESDQMVPVILQCRTPRETNPKGLLGPNNVSIKSLFVVPPWWSWYVLSPSHALARHGRTRALSRFCYQKNNGTRSTTRIGHSADSWAFSRFCCTLYRTKKGTRSTSRYDAIPQYTVQKLSLIHI